MEEVNKQNTIYDISKASGVSIATVSRVLNDSPKVSLKTKEKVLAVMKEMHYEPNIFARGLGSGSAKTIGILCADVSDIYLANAVSFLEREIRSEGFDTILYCTGYEYDNKVRGLKTILSHKVDSVVIVGSHYVEKIEKKNKYIVDASKNIPIMLLNGYIPGDNIYCSVSNEKQSFSDVVTLLANKGCKNIAFLYREETYSRNNKFEGYMDGLKKNGLSFREDYVFQSNEKIQNIKSDLEYYLKNHSEVDGLIACDDELALGALKYFSINNIKVPDTVSLVGCNNSVLSISCEPELTSVDNMCEALCVNIIASLMRLYNNQDVPNLTEMSCKIVERGTTKK